MLKQDIMSNYSIYKFFAIENNIYILVSWAMITLTRELCIYFYGLVRC